MERINEIMAKGSFSSEDMDFLMKNRALLTQDHLVRLGLAPAAPVLVAKEPVKVVEAPKVEAPKVVATPKKRGRPSVK